MEIITKQICAELCVVGGGVAGICAAIAAARNGVKTVLVQDRSVLGGNASSEIRMWICGAQGAENKEAGILEELQLENIFSNPTLNYHIWDHVLYGKCIAEENLQLILNCSVFDISTNNEKNRITKLKSWHLHEQCFYEIYADNFADCSGDSVLRYSGANFTSGREGKNDFDESHAPEVADKFTMGNSILLQVRKTDFPHRPFVAPKWAFKYNDETIPTRHMHVTETNNFWWIEIGGTQNTITDSDEIRNELLKIAYGIWDYIKNHPDKRGHNWELTWIGSLPGKRENIRYIGDHILNQNDVESQGKDFEDLIAYGGWPMDVHHPEGIYYPNSPNIFHETPSPFGIPYRSLYSNNIDNLLFAGRNISATHIGMSAIRVMGTTAIMGQALGTAVSIMKDYKLATPKEVYQSGKYKELQTRLMEQDCYLPWHKREIPQLAKNAKLTSSNGESIEKIRNGIERNLAGIDNGWWGKKEDYLQYEFTQASTINSIRIVFDSDFSLPKKMLCHYEQDNFCAKYPKMLVKKFAIEVKYENSKDWEIIKLVDNNKNRLVNINNLNLKGVLFCRLKLVEMYDNQSLGHVFSFDFKN